MWASWKDALLAEEDAEETAVMTKVLNEGLYKGMIFDRVIA